MNTPRLPLRRLLVAITPCTLLLPATACEGPTPPPAAPPEAVQLAFVQEPPSSGTAGVALAPEIVVEAQDEDGVAVAHTGTVSLVLVENPGAANLTGVTSVAFFEGSARFENVVLDRAATGYRLVATSSGLAEATSAPFDIVAGHAAAIGLHGGDDQVAATGSILPQPLAVLVTDAFDNPVEGVDVRWLLDAEDGGAVGADSTLTDASGIAEVQRTLGPATGPQYTYAALGEDAVVFTSLAHIDGVVEIRMHDGGGDDQIDTVLATLPLPFEAVVLGLEGEPVEGVEVAWSAPYGTLSAHLDTTDADGVTRVTLTLSDEARTHPVQASVENLQGSPVVFTADAEPGALAVLTEYHDTDGQIGAVGERLDLPYSVVARDAHGNAKRGVLIDWSVASGGGSVNPDTQTTDYDDASDEPYALAYHTLGPDEGLQAVIASTPGPGGTVELEFESRAVSARVEVVFDYYYDYDWQFESDSASIAAGQTVAWMWPGGFTAHNVTFEDDPTTPVSSDTQTSGHHLRTFDVPGQYRYRCTIHSTDFTTGMTGVVVVE